MGNGPSMEQNFENMKNLFGGAFDFAILFYILFGVVFVGIFVTAIVLIFSPKARGKMMSKQVKATRYAVEESEEDIKVITDTLADATHDALRDTVAAVREGLTDEQVFCKHCGKSIDADSKFCRECGKEQ